MAAHSTPTRAVARPDARGAQGATTVRVGVIGAGEISEYHLGGLASLEGAEVVVIADRSPARAAERARQFGVPEVADDWRRVVERRDLDAVVVATPDETHPE